MLQQFIHRCMHNLSDRLRINTHRQSTDSQHCIDEEFALSNIGQFSNVLVFNSTKSHALEHPQSISSTNNQRCGSSKCNPEIILNRAQSNHELANKAGSTWQTCIGHREQQEERCKLRHDIHNATVICDLARMHTVIQNTDAEEHCARHKTVGNHLNQCAFNTQRIEDEEAQSHEAHVRN